MQVERERQEAATALAQVQNLIRRAEAVLTAAERDGKSSTALAAVREVRACVDLMARLTGELNERPQVTVFNLLSEPVIACLDVIYSELHDQPELRQRIAARLQGEQPAPLQLEAPR